MTLIGTTMALNELFAKEESLVYLQNMGEKGSIKLRLEHCLVIDNEGRDVYTKNNIETEIKSSAFIKTSLAANTNATRGLRFEDPSTILIENSRFKGYESRFSAFQVISSSSKAFLSVKESEFFKISSIESGGAMYLEGKVDCTLLSSKFINISTRENGGVLEVNCVSEEDCSLKIENNSFVSTFAEKYGSVVFSRNKKSVKLSDSNSFTDNIDGKSYQRNETTASLPSEILFVKSESGDIKNKVRSILYQGPENDDSLKKETSEIGSGIPFNLIAVITNNERGLYNQDNLGTVKISLKESLKTSFLMNSVANVRKGVAVFEQITLISAPGESIEVLVSYSNNQLNFTLEDKLTFVLRKCGRGEFLSGISCQQCPKDFYSLSDDPEKENIKACNICPASAECPGRDAVFPVAGFWRKDENQSTVIKCDSIEACPAGHSTSSNSLTFTPRCGTGYEGPRCSLCKQSYGANVEKLCLMCSDSFLHFIKFALLCIFSLALILYQTEMALKINVSASQSRCLMKLLIDHWSYVSFVSSYKITWETNVFDILNVADNYISAAPGEIFNFDCFLALFLDKDKKFLINNILIILSPIFYSILCYLFMILFAKIKEYLQIVTKSFKGSHKKLEKGKLQGNEPIFTEDPEMAQAQTSVAGESKERPGPSKVMSLTLNNNNQNITENPESAQAQEPVADESKEQLKKNGVVSVNSIPNIKQDPETAQAQTPVAHTRTNKKRSLILAMLILIFYNFYSRLILSAAKLLHCIRLDDSEEVYMEANNSVVCWRETHLGYVLYLSLLNICIWGIAIPILIFFLARKLKSFKTELNDEYTQKLLEFITLDFKPQYYYWDLVTYLSKLILVFLKILTSSLETSSQGAIVILFLLILFLIQEKFKPYEYQFINNLKTISLMTTICSLAFIVMASLDDIKPSHVQGFIFVSIAFTLLFYIAWFKQFFELKKNVLKEKFQKGRKSKQLIQIEQKL